MFTVKLQIKDASVFCYSHLLPRRSTRRMSFIKSFATIDALAMKQPPFSVAITFASGTCAIETKGAKSNGNGEGNGEGSAYRAVRTFLSFEFIVCAPSRRVDARISPRRNNRSFNSDAGSLSLSPVKRRPAEVSSSLTSHLYFAPCFSRRALYYRRGDDLQNKPSPFDFRQASRAQAVRRLSSVRIKLPFYYP